MCKTLDETLSFHFRMSIVFKPTLPAIAALSGQAGGYLDPSAGFP